MSRTGHATGIVMFNCFEFIYCCIKVGGVLWYIYSCISTVMHDFIQYDYYPLHVMGNFTTGKFYGQIPLHLYM